MEMITDGGHSLKMGNEFPDRAGSGSQRSTDIKYKTCSQIIKLLFSYWPSSGWINVAFS